MPQSFASLHCHIVLSTKHREPLITGDLPPRLYGYLGGNQKEHHRALAFKEEFLEILHRHNPQWDERYVWD